MALLVANHPRQLDDPAELITNTINESLDTFGGRARFSLQQFIEGGALAAVTEPGLTGRPQQQRGYNGYKQRDEVFYEQRTPRRTPVCQSAFKFDPASASNFDPLGRRVLAVALAPSE